MKLRVVIIEDDDNKAAALLSHLEQHVSVESVYRAPSMKSGLEAILNRSPDLVVLDMSLPASDAGSDLVEPGFERTGGREILRQVARKKLNVRVIVVTQYDFFGDDGASLSRAEVTSQLEQRFRGVFLGTVRYRSGDDGWKLDVNSYIEAISGDESPTERVE